MLHLQIPQNESIIYTNIWESSILINQKGGQCNLPVLVFWGDFSSLFWTILVMFSLSFWTVLAGPIFITADVCLVLSGPACVLGLIDGPMPLILVLLLPQTTGPDLPWVLKAKIETLGWVWCGRKNGPLHELSTSFVKVMLNNYLSYNKFYLLSSPSRNS